MMALQCTMQMLQRVAVETQQHPGSTPPVVRTISEQTALADTVRR
jgi:hypothetical protein